MSAVTKSVTLGLTLKARMSATKLLTERQLVFYFGLNQHSIHSARSNKPNLNAPPFIRQGRAVRYDLDAVIAWVVGEGFESSSGHRKPTICDAL